MKRLLCVLAVAAMGLFLLLVLGEWVSVVVVILLLVVGLLDLYYGDR